MTRKQGVEVLSNIGFYREAVQVAKFGNLLCGLTDKCYTITLLLTRFKCKSNVTRSGHYERFLFSD